MTPDGVVVALRLHRFQFALAPPVQFVVARWSRSGGRPPIYKVTNENDDEARPDVRPHTVKGSVVAHRQQ